MKIKDLIKHLESLNQEAVVCLETADGEILEYDFEQDASCQTNDYLTGEDFIEGATIFLMSY
jgi:hypothetical protein